MSRTLGFPPQRSLEAGVPAGRLRGPRRGGARGGPGRRRPTSTVAENWGDIVEDPSRAGTEVAPGGTPGEPVAADWTPPGAPPPLPCAARSRSAFLVRLFYGNSDRNTTRVVATPAKPRVSALYPAAK